MKCDDTQLSGGSSISSRRSPIGVLNRADFLKGAFKVRAAVTPCHTEQSMSSVKMHDLYGLLFFNEPKNRT